MDYMAVRAGHIVEDSSSVNVPSVKLVDITWDRNSRLPTIVGDQRL